MKDFAIEHPYFSAVLIFLITAIGLFLPFLLFAIYIVSTSKSPPPNDGGAMAAGFIIYLSMPVCFALGLIASFVSLFMLKKQYNKIYLS
jgi:hypothetical protein